MPSRLASPQVNSQSFCAGTPDGAEALGALAQFGFVPCDAHGDDLVVALARHTGPRAAGNRLDDEFDGLQAAAVLFVVKVTYANKTPAKALEQFLGPALARPQGNARLHEAKTARGLGALTAGKIGHFSP
jgi:hypothetical protein